MSGMFHCGTIPPYGIWNKAVPGVLRQTHKGLRHVPMVRPRVTGCYSVLMARRLTVVLVVLLGLGVASQQALACSNMSASGGAHHECCDGNDGRSGHPAPCDSPAVFPDFACPQGPCAAGLTPALGMALQAQQQTERLQFLPLDPASFSHRLLTLGVDDLVDPSAVPWAAGLKPETLVAAPAAYLHTLRLRL